MKVRFAGPSSASFLETPSGPEKLAMSR